MDQKIKQELLERVLGAVNNIRPYLEADRAGIKASMRGIDMMLEGGLNVKAVPFPDGEDPDSYAKQLGEVEFKQYLENQAVDFLRFKTKIYLEENGHDPLRKAETIREIVQSISLIPDAIKRTVYLQECSDLLGVEETTLIQETNKLLIKNRREQGSKFEPIPEPQPIVPEQLEEEKLNRDDIIANQERESIRMLINYSTEVINEFEDQEINVLEYFLAEAEDINFTNPVYTKILSIFKEELSQGRIIDAQFLLEYPDKEIQKIAVDLSAEKYELSPNWSGKYQIAVAHEKDSLKDATYHNVLRLKFRIIQKMIEENLHKLKDAEDESSINEFLEIQSSLKNMEMSIAQILGNVTVK